jgi:hypothetical protein
VKTLWRLISIVAVANLLALGALAWWLVSTERLDRDRLMSLRALLAEPLPAQRARLEAERAREAAEAAEALAIASASLPPFDAADLLRARLDSDEVHRQRLLRFQREMEDLRRTIGGEWQRLDDERARFEAEKAAFEAQRADIIAQEGSEQFRKALVVYESLRPAQAKDALSELIARGHTLQAVTYLSAMDERTRTRIIDQFTRDDPSLAADLLELVRTHGLEVRRAEAGPG